MDPLTIARLTGTTRIEIGLEEILLRLGVAFLLSVTIALTYRRTHKAFAFSYSMTVSLILVSVIVAMVLMVIDNSLARAFGLVGALAIIRFRTPIKDIRDIVFLFLSVGNGIASGAGAYEIAVAGVISANIISIVLFSTRFGGTIRSDDVLVKIRYLPGEFQEGGGSFDDVLQKFCDSYSLIEMQRAADVPGENIYSVRIAQAGRIEEMVDELQGITGVNQVVILSSVHNMDMQ